MNPSTDKIEHSERVLIFLESQDIGGYSLLPGFHLATMKESNQKRRFVAVLKSNGVEYPLMNEVMRTQFLRWNEGDVVKVMLPTEGYDLAYVYDWVELAPSTPACKCCGQEIK